MKVPVGQTPSRADLTRTNLSLIMEQGYFKLPKLPVLYK